MAFNGSGIFGRLYNWVNDRDAGIKILASRMDDEFNGIATGLSTCITKDGQTAVTADIKLSSHKLIDLADGTALTHAASVSQVQKNVVAFCAAGGTADAITGAFTPTITSLTNGMIVRVAASAANATTTPTFRAESLDSARTITKFGGQALLVGDIRGAGHILKLQWVSASTRWELLNPATPSYLSSSAGVIAVLESTDGSSSAGPTLEAYRNSPDPAASDRIGEVRFTGEDSAGNKESYAALQATILSPTNTSESGSLKIQVQTNGGGLADVAEFAGDRQQAMTLISVQTASSSATINFVITNYTSLYRAFKVIITGVTPATDSQNLWIRTSADGGSNYDAGASDYSWAKSLIVDTGANNPTADTADDSIEIATTVGNLGNEGVNGEVDFYELSNAGGRSRITWRSIYQSGTPNMILETGVGRRIAASDIDAIRFMFANGNIASGTFALYGIR